MIGEWTTHKSRPGFGAGRLHEIYLDSVEEALDLGMNPSDKNRKTRCWNNRCKGGRNYDLAWTGGCDGLPGYRKLLENGWPEGARQARENLNALAVPAVRDIRRRRRWADNGDEMCVDRARTGRLDVAWQGTHRATVVGTAARTIWVSCSGNSFRSAREFLWSGAAACVLADAMEEAGFRVEIICYQTVTGLFQGDNKYGDRATTMIGFKHEREPLDINHLALMCHAATLRCLVFGVELAADRKCLETMGAPDHQSVPPLMRPDDLIISGIFTKDSAQRWLDKQAEEIGQEVGA